MDIQEIYALMDRFDASSLNRLKLKMGETTLLLEKGLTFLPTAGTGELQKADPVAVSTAKEESDKRKEEIKAPFVGTFYIAPSPEEKPFVAQGQRVKKGDVVGIIEAMKLMNEILAPRDGVIEAVLAEDGALVEYNQPLIILK